MQFLVTCPTSFSFWLDINISKVPWAFYYVKCMIRVHSCECDNIKGVSLLPWLTLCIDFCVCHRELLCPLGNLTKIRFAVSLLSFSKWSFLACFSGHALGRCKMIVNAKLYQGCLVCCGSCTVYKQAGFHSTQDLELYWYCYNSSVMSGVFTFSMSHKKQMINFDLYNSV